ncbi:AraC family transcriptional regulator [Marinobacter sp. chi1]|uniref:AraC family transcriptional regulator n=1 Tax=Marinobacter suaedae TaxID=3057675 RepID=A0ABT8VY76_9GAMM|nr:AraC family transcriptional regulator [Marinobacter sp. chi1]MDO3720948.1 AraC family transcriptional regulator [Marinobacter sp. chi1]
MTKSGLIALLALALCTLLGGQASASEAESSVVDGEQAAKPAAPLEQILETPMSVRESRERAQRAVNDLSREIQDLKQSVVTLNKDLRVLEEDLLFPANTRFHVFLSLDVGEFFRLEGVELRLNNETVASYLYSEEERTALAKGGMHRLHLGNVSAGEHTLSAFFIGQGPNGREYKRGSSLRFTKGQGPKYVELSIADSEARQQPEFAIREW